jgi:hypothetical protein
MWCANRLITLDALDRLAYRDFPEGSTLQWIYDGARLVRIESGLSNVIPLSSASYDALGRPTQLEIGERLISGSQTSPAASIDYEFSATTARLSRILSKRHPDAGASTVMDMTTTFDGLGRLTDQGGTFEGQTLNRSFGYDGLGRMQTATGPWEPGGGSSTWTHAYDPLGNLRSLSSSTSYTRSWTYGDTLRPRVLTAFSENGGIFDSSITTDAAGNLASRVRGGLTQSFTWNAQNRLYTITGYNPVESFFLSYDAFGRRVHQQITGGSTPTELFYVGADFEYDKTLQQANLFFFVGGQRIASFARFGNYYAGDGWTAWDDFGRRVAPPIGGLVLLVGLAGIVVLATRRRPAWLAGAGAGFLGADILLLPIPASTGGGGGSSVHGSHGEQGGVYYLPDHLGSTRAVVDLYGAVLETRDYDPWGNSIAHTGTFNLKHRFTGQPISEVDPIPWTTFSLS